jgi:hypothetical protein
MCIPIVCLQLGVLGSWFVSTVVVLYYFAYIQALQDAFLAIDAKLTTEEVIKELAQIAGRPTEDEDDKDKVADEDDGECVRKK